MKAAGWWERYAHMLWNTWLTCLPCLVSGGGIGPRSISGLSPEGEIGNPTRGRAPLLDFATVCFRMGDILVSPFKGRLGIAPLDRPGLFSQLSATASKGVR